MEVKSTTKFARISPLKARDVAREIQGLPVSQALDILTFTRRKAAFLVNKTLKSAIANAENNHELAVDSLVIKEAVVGAGPAFRRHKPRARGSAGAIRKRTSHICITLSDELEIPEPRKRKATVKTKRKRRLAAAAAAAKAKKKPAPAKQEKAPEEEDKPEASTEETPAAAEASAEAPAETQAPVEETKESAEE